MLDDDSVLSHQRNHIGDRSERSEGEKFDQEITGSVVDLLSTSIFPSQRPA
jgi:hypothetical protein